MTYMTMEAPGRSGFGLGAEAAAAQTVPLNQRDVMSRKIDVFAQRALFRMLKGSEEARLAARHMVWAVKRGALAGIYKEDQQAPALRARAVGKGWWQLIPKGAQAICLKVPAGRPPMIVFRNAVRSNPDILDPALQNAWESCAISQETPPPYVPKSFPGYTPVKAKDPGKIDPGSIPWVVRPDHVPGVPVDRPQCDADELGRRRTACKTTYGKCWANCTLTTGVKNYPPACLWKAIRGDLPGTVACAIKHKVPFPTIQHAYEWLQCMRKGCDPALRSCIDAARDQTYCPVSGLGQPACTFETGEQRASYTSAGILTQDVSVTPNGILAADFGVDRRSVKPVTKAQLAPWLKEFESDRVLKLRIYGLTDCSGKEGHNTWLRKQRALRVYALLGPKAKKKVEFVRAAPDALLPGTNANRVERARNRGVLIQFDRSVDIPDDQPIPATPCHVQLLKKAVTLVSGSTALDTQKRLRLQLALLLAVRGGNDAFIRPGKGSLAIPFHWTTITDYFRMLCQAPDPSVRTTSAGLLKMMQWLDDDIVNGRRSYEITRRQASSLTRQMIDTNFTGRLNALLKNKSQSVYAGY